MYTSRERERERETEIYTTSKLTCVDRKLAITQHQKIQKRLHEKRDVLNCFRHAVL